MSPQIKYAYKTHNTWVYRRTYPKALQPLLGSALKQSLKTGDATQAKARVAELNQTFTTIIKEAQGAELGKEWFEMSKRSASFMRIDREVLELMASPFVSRSRKP